MTSINRRLFEPYSDNNANTVIVLLFSTSTICKQLPHYHPLIGATHNNIALVYSSMKDYSNALIHFKETLEIEQKSFVHDHPSLVMTHTNIAGVFEDLHQYKEAIEHAEKAVNILL
ncbi:unnamed protein product, partial [Rotaria sp. Silwood1]